LNESLKKEELDEVLNGLSDMALAGTFLYFSTLMQ